MTLSIKLLQPNTFDAWDRFVIQHPDGTFCHRAGWKTVVEKGAGHVGRFLFAERDGAIVGVLPLSIRRSRLFGNAVISNMFGVYGGPLAVEDEALKALDCEAQKLMKSVGGDFLEYRTRVARHTNMQGWYEKPPSAATFIKELKGETDDELLTAIPRKQRAVVRKSLSKGLSTDWNGDLETFYHLYSQSVRNLGTPVFGKKLFKTMLHAFPEDVLVQVTCDAHGRPAASLFSFLHNDTVLPYYAGGGPLARQLHAHEFMYYDLMKKAVSLGKNTFDFGRSKIDSGPYKFKKNWGFDPQPLHYEYFLPEGGGLPDHSPQNPRYQAMISVWKRLPLWLANRLGPPIARHLG
ncbi:MAG: FemAB family PEP-CTERM system-associated protein [Alphaproteobacteria bacterium]|nr:FemAB family PEP-CTERM system-associated protein [Alphaproteobacteria bacterium]